MHEWVFARISLLPQCNPRLDAWLEHGHNKVLSDMTFLADFHASSFFAFPWQGAFTNGSQMVSNRAMGRGKEMFVATSVIP